MNTNVFLGIWLACTAVGMAADKPPLVRGRVVNEQGRPVADAEVDFFWRGNGSDRDKGGNLLALNDDAENQKTFWDHLGEMAPGRPPAPNENRRTGPDGRFSLSIEETPAFTLMAMDRARVRGGLGVVPKDYAGSDLEIRLGPLVQVRGSFASPNPAKRLGWTYADVCVPEDPTRPVGFTRLAGCGSHEGQIKLSLPVGRYVVYANNDDQDWELRLVPPRQLVLTAENLDVDLGVLRLTEKPSVRFKERQAKKQGTLGDYTKHYGRQPPRWHAIDARGVNKDIEVAAFKGKWVLLDFWGLSCSVCLRKTMPALIQFYEEHAADRDRFEILSICIDVDDELQSMADLDRALQPIIKHAWGGKTIPFPILLDNTFETWQNFGIPGLGFVLLIDPEGNLVAGNQDTLAERLKR